MEDFSGRRSLQHGQYFLVKNDESEIFELTGNMKAEDYLYVTCDDSSFTEFFDLANNPPHYLPDANVANITGRDLIKLYYQLEGELILIDVSHASW